MGTVRSIGAGKGRKDKSILMYRPMCQCAINKMEP